MLITRVWKTMGTVENNGNCGKHWELWKTMGTVENYILCCIE